METNGAQRGSSSEEVVERYFSVKITEARQNGDENLLKFLEASLRTWNEKRQLHVQLNRDINAWDKETGAMNSLVETGQLFVPKGALRRAVGTCTAPAADTVVVFSLMSLLTSLLFFSALDSGDPDIWIATVIAAVIWGFTAKQALVQHRKGS